MEKLGEYKRHKIENAKDAQVMIERKEHRYYLRVNGEIFQKFLRWRTSYLNQQVLKSSKSQTVKYKEIST